MTTPPYKLQTIRNIAVALDCSPHSLASLAAAAALAGRLEAGLTGIFIEDINLFRLAEHAFAEELKAYDEEASKLDTETLTRGMRRQAMEARSLLEKEAGRYSVQTDFKIKRGFVPSEVLEASLHTDLLVLGRSGRSPSCRKGLGSTARMAIMEGRGPRLLMRPGFQDAALPVMVLFDDSMAARKSLGTALTILPEKGLLQILLLSNDPSEAMAMESSIEAEPSLQAIQKEYFPIPASTPDVLARYIRMVGSGILVLSALMHLTKEEIITIIDKVDTPVLIV